MPATYSPIATNTISGSSTSTVTFSNISSAFTDLVVVFGNFSGQASYSFSLRFNGDTGSNYVYVNLEGNGTTVTATNNSGTTGIFTGGVIGFPDNKSSAIFNIGNYSSTFGYKPVVGRTGYNGTGVAGVNLTGGTWNSTAAITSINTFIGAGNFADGGQITLYGIKKA